VSCVTLCRSLEQVAYLTNSSMMAVDFLPRHLVIVGGSYVGLEFAQMYRRFGSEVTVIEMGPRLINREDPDVSAAIGEILRSQLGVGLPRYTLARLYDACGGNPFYALESARSLVGHQRTSLASGPIPVPKSLGDLVRHHLRGLSAEARDVGRLVAASSDPRERVIQCSRAIVAESPALRRTGCPRLRGA